jgi:signal peptidase I
MKRMPNSWRQTVWGQIVELALLLLLVFLIRTVGFGLYQVPSGSMETTMLVGERFFADKLSYWFRAPQRGEIIACNAPTFQYSPGALNRFIEKYVWGPDNWTKRVIGVPGDHLKGVIEDEKPVIYLNGKKLDEPYLNKYPLAIEFNVDRLGRPIKETRKSYDPSKSAENQPFYRVNPALLGHDPQTHELVLIYPDRYEKASRAMPEGCKRFFGRNADEFEITLGADEFWLMGDNRRDSCDSRSWGPVKREIIHGRIIFRIWSVDS